MTNRNPDKKHTLNPENWVDHYGDFLFRYAVVRIYSPEVAEDLVQDTFVSAIEAKNRFQGMSTEKTWLVSILKRKIVDYFRNQSKPIDQRAAGYWFGERVFYVIPAFSVYGSD